MPSPRLLHTCTVQSSHMLLNYEPNCAVQCTQHGMPYYYLGTHATCTILKIATLLTLLKRIPLQTLRVLCACRKHNCMHLSAFASGGNLVPTHLYISCNVYVNGVRVKTYYTYTRTLCSDTRVFLASNRHDSYFCDIFPLAIHTHSYSTQRPSTLFPARTATTTPSVAACAISHLITSLSFASNFMTAPSSSQLTQGPGRL
ncbi:hypothetical protein EDC01DRAFT_82538 [Geopyxis carbonaria]|nr:hypothetical protein EDC01DRAFT_82538 [Geopyxis carbonaria]